MSRGRIAWAAVVGAAFLVVLLASRLSGGGPLERQDQAESPPVRAPTPTAPPAKAQTPPTAVLRLSSPQDGMRVRRHYVRITGRLLGDGPRPAQIFAQAPGVEASDEIEQGDGSFTARLPLREGVNTIRVEASPYPEQEETQPLVLARRTITVQRVRWRRSRDDGALDLATAWQVARANLYLCGETDGGGCYSQPHCVRLTRTRVDCPSTVHWDDARVGRCGVVYSVERRPDRRVFFGAYRCNYKLMPPGTAAQFVRPWVTGGRRRYVSERHLDWTPYGIPRFDVFTNRLVP